MGLPDTREMTLNPGDDFPSNVGNAIQDAIVGLGLDRTTAFNALLKGVLEQLRAGPDDGYAAVLSAPALRPLGRAGDAYVSTTSTNPHVNFKGGLWVQSGGPANMPTMAYVAEDDEVGLVAAKPSGTNFRRDIYSAKLAVVGGLVQLQGQYTAGAEGATEALAVEPATPAGYTKIWSGVIQGGVGATHFDREKQRDYRLPLGLQETFLRFTGALYNSADWSLVGGALPQLQANGVGKTLHLWAPPNLARQQRLIGLGLCGVLPAGVTVELCRFSWGNGGTPFGVTVLRDISALVIPVAANGENFISLDDPTPLGDGSVLTTFMGDGSPVIDDYTPRLPVDFLGLRLTSQAAADAFNFARFLWAGSLV